MLSFINSNGVLFSGIFAIIVALISALVTIVVENRKNRGDTIKSLKEELRLTKQELEVTKIALNDAQSVEKAEKNIDKTHGSIYYERVADNKERTICGFCWEKEHIKIPIVVDICYEEYTKQSYYDGFCNSCKSHCIDNIYNDDSLPF